MTNRKPYKLPDLEPFILDNEPIVYGGKLISIPICILSEGVKNDPVQLAAIYLLQKMHIPTNVENPLCELMISIYNMETPDDALFTMSIRDDMVNMLFDLESYTLKEFNDFLFTDFKELDKEEVIQKKERIASEIIIAKDEDELREILIRELLYSAMMYHYDWPRQ